MDWIYRKTKARDNKRFHKNAFGQADATARFSLLFEKDGE